LQAKGNATKDQQLLESSQGFITTDVRFFKRQRVRSFTKYER
jgi:hypothetical protein